MKLSIYIWNLLIIETSSESILQSFLQNIIPYYDLNYVNHFRIGSNSTLVDLKDFEIPSMVFNVDELSETSNIFGLRIFYLDHIQKHFHVPKYDFSSNIMSIVWIGKCFESDLHGLQIVFDVLQLAPESKIILIFENRFQWSVLEQFSKKKFVNTVAIELEDFSKVFTVTFPAMSLLIKNTDDPNMFENNIMNINKVVVRAECSNEAPNCMYYHDIDRGIDHFFGIGAHLVRKFVQHI